MLKDANYEDDKREFLYQGFKQGFSLGYKSENKVQLTSKNLKLRVGDHVDLWNKVMKETQKICRFIRYNTI